MTPTPGRHCCLAFFQVAALCRRRRRRRRRLSASLSVALNGGLHARGRPAAATTTVFRVAAAAHTHIIRRPPPPPPPSLSDRRSRRRPLLLAQPFRSPTPPLPRTLAGLPRQLRFFSPPPARALRRHWLSGPTRWAPHMHLLGTVCGQTRSHGERGIRLRVIMEYGSDSVRLSASRCTHAEGSGCQ
jgi:hypothetical protein